MNFMASSEKGKNMVNKNWYAKSELCPSLSSLVPIYPKIIINSNYMDCNWQYSLPVHMVRRQPSRFPIRSKSAEHLFFHGAAEGGNVKSGIIE